MATRAADPRRGVVTLAVGGTVTLLFMGMLVFRLRTVLAAVRGVAAGAMAARARVADTIGPALEFVFEPAIYPVTMAPPRGAAASGAGGARPTGPTAEGPLRGALEHAEHRRHAGQQLHGRRDRAGPDRVRPERVRSLRRLPGRDHGPAQRQRAGHRAAVVRWEGDVRVFARTVLTLSVASSYRHLRRGCSSRAPQIAAGCSGRLTPPAMLRVLCAGRDHRRVRLRPAGPAHPGLRAGPPHDRRHAQLRGQHRR